VVEANGVARLFFLLLLPIFLYIGSVGEVGKEIRKSKLAVGLFGSQRYGCCGKLGMTKSLIENLCGGRVSGGD
jgi:hypothetical protein